MFPAPIATRAPATRIAYAAVVLACLAVWLLPLAAVALTSIRSLDDLNRGNFWGWPSNVALVGNYAAVLGGSNMLRFVANSFMITVPAAVICGVTLSVSAASLNVTVTVLLATV